MIGDLSRAALEYASTLKGLTAHELSARLYSFNRLPASGKWGKRIADAHSSADVLGFRRFLPSPVSGNAWLSASPPDPENGWFMWYRRGFQTGTLLNCKLYISILPDALAGSFGSIVGVLADSRCVAFKVGANVPGLLRPDKLMAYFSRTGDLRAAASKLDDVLHGAPVHGVPFSAALDREGKISWGVDPKPTENGAPESWRLWVTNHLAMALVAAHDRGSEVSEAVARAVESLEAIGVDTTEWVLRNVDD